MADENVWMFVVGKQMACDGAGDLADAGKREIVGNYAAPA